MPIVDLPIDQLMEYQGINPKPKDFDAYWDQALHQMHQLEPEIEIIPADFQVPGFECSELYFTGVDKARIHVRYIRPQHAASPHPALLLFHGYSGNAGDWYNKLGYAALGFSVFAMDCRGQRGTSQDSGVYTGDTFRGHIIRGLDDGPEHLLFRKIFLDTAQLASIAMKMDDVDPEKIIAKGGSQGGGLSIACAALEPKVKAVISLYPFLSDYKRVWELDLAKNAYEEISTYFRFYDNRHTREEEIFTTLGYIDVQNLAPRIKAKVWLGATLMDTICPPSTQFAVYNKLRTEKELLVYPDFGHEDIPGFHDLTLQQVLQYLNIQ